MSAGGAISAHTPGPWTVLAEECDRPYIRVRGTALGMRFKVANVLTPAHEGVHPRDADETRANARLIAAAPDLLEVAREYQQVFAELGKLCECGQADCRTTRLRAAIAKATGGQS